MTPRLEIEAALMAHLMPPDNGVFPSHAVEPAYWEKVVRITKAAADALLAASEAEPNPATPEDLEQVAKDCKRLASELRAKAESGEDHLVAESWDNAAEIICRYLPVGKGEKERIREICKRNEMPDYFTPLGDILAIIDGAQGTSPSAAEAQTPDAGVGPSNPKDAKCICGHKMYMHWGNDAHCTNYANGDCNDASQRCRCTEFVEACPNCGNPLTPGHVCTKSKDTTVSWIAEPAPSSRRVEDWTVATAQDGDSAEWFDIAYHEWTPIAITHGKIAVLGNHPMMCKLDDPSFPKNRIRNIRLAQPQANEVAKLQEELAVATAKVKELEFHRNRHYGEKDDLFTVIETLKKELAAVKAERDTCKRNFGLSESYLKSAQEIAQTNADKCHKLGKNLEAARRELDLTRQAMGDVLQQRQIDSIADRMDVLRTATQPTSKREEQT